MDQDIIDQLSEISAIYNNLVCREMETNALADTLNKLELISQHLTTKLYNEIRAAIKEEINNG